MATRHDCARLIGNRTDRDIYILIGTVAALGFIMTLLGWSDDRIENILPLLLIPLILLFKPFRFSAGEIDVHQNMALSHRKASWFVQDIFGTLSNQYDWFTSVWLVPQGKDIDFILVGPEGVTPIELKGWSNSTILEPAHWFQKLGFMTSSEPDDTVRMKEVLTSIGVPSGIVTPVVVRADCPNTPSRAIVGGTEVGLNHFAAYITQHSVHQLISDAERATLVAMMHEKAGCGGWGKRTTGQKVAGILFKLFLWSIFIYSFWIMWNMDFGA